MKLTWAEWLGVACFVGAIVLGWVIALAVTR